MSLSEQEVGLRLVGQLATVGQESDERVIVDSPDARPREAWRFLAVLTGIAALAAVATALAGYLDGATGESMAGASMTGGREVMGPVGIALALVWVWAVALHLQRTLGRSVARMVRRGGVVEFVSLGFLRPRVWTVPARHVRFRAEPERDRHLFKRWTVEVQGETEPYVLGAKAAVMAVPELRSLGRRTLDRHQAA